MVGYLVRLRLRLAWRNLTTSTGRIIASAVALLYALGLLGGLGAGVLLQALPDEVMRHLSGPRPLAWLVTAARWTPFGWCWSLPWDAQQGAWTPLAVHLVASLALIAVLARCWTGLVERALVNPGTRSVEAVRIRGSRLDALLPGGLMGALMGRELRYWRRDSRRLTQLLGLVAVPVVMLVPALTEGRTELLLGAPFLCAVMTATVSAWGLSHDGSALWILALAQVSAGRERAARVAVVALLTGPLLAANLVVTLALSPGLDVPGLLGMTIGPWLVALGTGTWVDSMWQQSLPPPAAGLSVRSTSSSIEGLVGSLLSMAVPVIGALPSTVLFALASMGARGLGWAGLAVGLLIGALACWGGIRLAGRRLERTWPEILVKVAERTA